MAGSLNSNFEESQSSSAERQDSSVANYPLLFGFRDIIQGDGFIARVAVQGPALMQVEGPPEEV
jgi:hypothetical protein